jgi:hypothetical protein
VVNIGQGAQRLCEKGITARSVRRRFPRGADGQSLFLQHDEAIGTDVAQLLAVLVSLEVSQRCWLLWNHS